MYINHFILIWAVEHLQSESAIDQSCFSEFLNVVRGRDFCGLPADSAVRFLPECRLLEKARLVLVFL
jgi:hypothetical protein